MKHIGYLKNTIQEYAWGSRSAIAELLGRQVPADKPQAELWMGAHPKAPSHVAIDGGYRSLAAIIAAYPIEVLGSETAHQFNAQLPFLFKILAAAKPLSIQAHPNQTEAKAGFAREEAAGIHKDAPERAYKDKQHKPECICALTDFWGLCGFRNRDEMIGLLERLCPTTLKNDMHILSKDRSGAGLQSFIKKLMGRNPKERADIVREACDQAGRDQATKGTAFEWVVRLNMTYPLDIGVIFPALLNLVHLKPGQALYLQPGELHAYLDGVGIELMANSDNVLRGGLTPKHIDVAELTRILTFEEKRVDILEPEPLSDVAGVYRTPAREFELSVISLKTGASYRGTEQRSVEILLCTSGQHRILQLDRAGAMPFTRGQSILIPAAASNYVIKGQGTIYKASVP